jgi:hypothetical protein
MITACEIKQTQRVHVARTETYLLILVWQVLPLPVVTPRT